MAIGASTHLFYRFVRIFLTVRAVLTNGACRDPIDSNCGNPAALARQRGAAGSLFLLPQASVRVEGVDRRTGPRLQFATNASACVPRSCPDACPTCRDLVLWTINLRTGCSTCSAPRMRRSRARARICNCWSTHCAREKSAGPGSAINWGFHASPPGNGFPRRPPVRPGGNHCSCCRLTGRQRIRRVRAIDL